jgi:DNA-binding CsgD family transcriptional regulator
MTATALPRSTALVDAGRDWGKPLTEADARALTAQIRTSVQELLPLIRTAFQRRADLALGYASWEVYCDAELIGLRLSVADRQEAVVGLRADGMSTRAIGAALGASEATVRRDLSTASSDALPDRIIGTDGREQPASRPAPKRTETPGPAAVRSTAPAGPGPISECLGRDMDCGRPLPCPDHPTPAPAADPMPSQEPAAERPNPTLRLVPDIEQVKADEQRDARAHLRRIVELAWSPNWPEGQVETWAKQLGPYDEELADLTRRALKAIAVLDELVEATGAAL